MRQKISHDGKNICEIKNSTTNLLMISAWSSIQNINKLQKIWQKNNFDKWTTKWHILQIHISCIPAMHVCNSHIYIYAAKSSAINRPKIVSLLSWRNVNRKCFMHELRQKNILINLIKKRRMNMNCILNATIWCGVSNFDCCVATVECGC